MLFSSWQFIFVFLPVALGVFLVLPGQWRVAKKLWLTVASLFFYAYWKVEYVPLLLFSIGFNYTIAELLLRYRDRPSGKWVLTGGVGVNLLLLGYYKYTNFVLSALGMVVRKDLGRYDIILPLAISFFTFTQIAYLVDVYRDHTRHYKFIDYFLFVVFFPHLIAGPIVRHWEIIPQYVERDLRPSRTDLGMGVLLFLLGLYKKLLLADPVSEYAIAVYGTAGHGVMVSWFDSWLGTLAFAMQIYFDFSGYSDMAIGLARMFGMRFPCNFDSPYRAGSIIDFWRRWHMTLTRFFREYVYIMLGGNRCSQWRQAYNIMVTMLLSGLWHGAGWNFVIWGGLHGLFLLVNHQWRNLKKARGWRLEHWSYRGACVAFTFLLVLVTWVFFRAPDLPTAGRLLGSMAGANGFTAQKEFQGSSREAEKIMAWLGAKAVDNTVPLTSADYRTALKILVALLFIAWCLPNTQQLLSAYEPTLEAVARPPPFRLRLNAWTGFACGVAFLFVIRGYFTLPQSPFLYFNF